MRVEFILQHGWGFDSLVWNGFISQLERFVPKVDIHTAERGYYGAIPMEPVFDERDTFKIIVAHSLGLHLLNPENIRQADAIFLISGFLNFHPADQLSFRRSKRTVKQMLEKLEHSPHLVLRDFLRNCYATQNENKEVASILPLLTVTDGEFIDKYMLIDDLQLLDSANLSSDLDKLKLKSQFYLIHGTADHIVSPDKSIELAGACPNANLVLIENGSHALPTTHADMCVSLIRNALTKCGFSVSTEDEPVCPPLLQAVPTNYFS